MGAAWEGTIVGIATYLEPPRRMALGEPARPDTLEASILQRPREDLDVLGAPPTPHRDTAIRAPYRLEGQARSTDGARQQRREPCVVALVEDVDACPVRADGTYEGAQRLEVLLIALI